MLYLYSTVLYVNLQVQLYFAPLKMSRKTKVHQLEGSNLMSLRRGTDWGYESLTLTGLGSAHWLCWLTSLSGE